MPVHPDLIAKAMSFIAKTMSLVAKTMSLVAKIVRLLARAMGFNSENNVICSKNNYIRDYIDTLKSRKQLICLQKNSVLIAKTISFDSKKTRSKTKTKKQLVLYCFFLQYNHFGSVFDSVLSSTCHLEICYRTK